MRGEVFTLSWDGWISTSFKGPGSNVSHSFLHWYQRRQWKLMRSHENGAAGLVTQYIQWHSGDFQKFTWFLCPGWWEDVMDIIMVWTVSVRQRKKPSTTNKHRYHCCALLGSCFAFYRTKWISASFSVLLVTLCWRWRLLFIGSFLFHFSLQGSTVQSGGVWIRRLHLAYWSLL